MSKKIAAVIAIVIVAISAFVAYQTFVNNQLSAEISRKDSVIIHLQGKIQDNRTTDNLNEMIEDLKGKLQTSNSTIDELTITIQTLNNRLQSSNVTIDVLKDTIDTLRDQLQNATIAMIESNRIIEELKLKLQVSNVTIENLNRTIDDLRNKLQMSTAMVDSLNRTVNELNSKLQVSNTTIEGLNKTVQELNTKLQENVMNIKNLNETIDALNREISNLKSAKVKAELRTIYHPRFWPWDTDNHEIKGTIINYGINKANNILIILHWYRQNIEIHRETLQYRELQGQTCIEVSINFAFNGQEDSFECQVFYDSQ
jgi:methyl-accepting chemotaxis protein